jgi:hypothetical protein
MQKFTRHIAAAALTVAIAAAPAFALAQTSTTTASSTPPAAVTSILAQIKSLIAQIEALKQQLHQTVGAGSESTASTTPDMTGKPCPTPNRNLGVGDRGDDVKDLQRFLASSTPEFSTDNVTGFFGPKTASALKHFQEDHIASSSAGTVGPLTRAFFGKHCGLVEGEGHLKGTAKSPFDMPMMGSTTLPMPHHGGHDGGDASSSESH